MASKFYVVRSHSHTDRQNLVKIMSRGFPDRLGAEDWKDFWEIVQKEKCRQKKNRRKYKFAVIEVQMEGQNLFP